MVCWVVVSGGGGGDVVVVVGCSHLWRLTVVEDGVCEVNGEEGTACDFVLLLFVVVVFVVFVTFAKLKFAWDRYVASDDEFCWVMLFQRFVRFSFSFGCSCSCCDDCCRDLKS